MVDAQPAAAMDHTPYPVGQATGTRPARIAYLSFSSGEYDARTLRMARSAVAAGAHVTVYARWHRGLPPLEVQDGYRLVRVPFDWQLAVPGLRRRARRRAARAMASSPARPTNARTSTTRRAAPAGSGNVLRRAARLPKRVAGRLAMTLVRSLADWHWWRRIREFPLRPLGWAAALDDVVEPADVWHGMWAGSLPALARIRRQHGGRTIYDSRDVFMRSRQFARLGTPGRSVLEWLERRWAGRADRVMTVNDAYAGLLETQLGVARPAVVMNCPETWTPPTPTPDLIREALRLPADTAIVLYQGILTFDRGIEQALDAIVLAPEATLVLLGFGPMLVELTRTVESAPYRGRVHMLPAVPPDDLLSWSASADALIMAIQPTTLNHRHTTPQKLFESLAAGVPVVASDLPGMAEIVRATNAGALCDPTSPTSIAEAIRQVVGAPAAERAAMRTRALQAAHERYNWEAQLDTLFAVYRELLPAGIAPLVAPTHR